MENTMGYSTEWQEYKGDYDKFEYDVIDKDGKIYRSCYPNAGKFNSYFGDGEVDGENVKEIRFSAEQKLMINPDEIYETRKRFKRIGVIGHIEPIAFSTIQKEFEKQNIGVFKIDTNDIKPNKFGEFEEKNPYESIVMKKISQSKNELSKIYDAITWADYNPEFPNNRAGRRKAEKEQRKWNKIKNKNKRK